MGDLSSIDATLAGHQDGICDLQCAQGWRCDRRSLMSTPHHPHHVEKQQMLTCPSCRRIYPYVFSTDHFRGLSQDPATAYGLDCS